MHQELQITIPVAVAATLIKVYPELLLWTEVCKFVAELT